MIVKVVTGDPAAPASYFEVGGEVSGGSHWFETSPMQAPRDYSVFLGEIAYGHYIHIAEEETPQRSQEPRPSMWRVHWARWRDSDGRPVAVVTSGDIYLMSERGDTIEKIR